MASKLAVLPLQSAETVEVVGKCHRSRIDTRDNRQRLGLTSERAQHPMREHDPLDAGCVGNAGDHGRGQMQLPCSPGFPFGNCVVRDE